MNNKQLNRVSNEWGEKALQDWRAQTKQPYYDALNADLRELDRLLESNDVEAMKQYLIRHGLLNN